MVFFKESPERVDSRISDSPLPSAPASLRDSSLPAATAADDGFSGLSSAAIESALRNGSSIASKTCRATVVLPQPLGPPTMKSSGIFFAQVLRPSARFRVILSRLRISFWAELVRLTLYSVPLIQEPLRAKLDLELGERHCRLGCAPVSYEIVIDILPELAPFAQI